MMSYGSHYEVVTTREPEEVKVVQELEVGRVFVL